MIIEHPPPNSHPTAPPSTWTAKLPIAPLPRPNHTTPFPLKPKRTRASKPKTKSGCRTCKIRRVKCDETKPSCQQCTRTHRICDGYDHPPLHSSHRSLVATTTPPDLPATLLWNPDPIRGSNRERRAFAFFQCVTGPQMASYFDATFWTRVLLQTSTGGDSAVRYAVIALGSLAEQRDRSVGLVPHHAFTGLGGVGMGMRMSGGGGGGVDCGAVDGDGRGRGNVGGRKVLSALRVADPDSPFALRMYNRALREMAARKEDGDGEVAEVMAVVGVLFMCIEFLRGNLHAAKRHFQGSVSIMRGLYGNSSVESRRNSTTLRDLGVQMVGFIDRLELLSTIFGSEESDWPYLTEAARIVPDQFESIRDVRDSIVHLTNWAVRFIHETKNRRYQKNISSEDIAWQSKLQSQLKLWDIAVASFLSDDKLSAHEADGMKLLKLHRTITGIWLAIALQREETYTDVLETEFEQAVQLAEDIQLFAGMPEQRDEFDVSFLFDMEIVCPLYFISLKCRHPVLRRRATAMLRKTVRREGLWDSSMIHALALKVIEIEERNLLFLDGSEMPPECDRIHLVQIQSEISVLPRRHRVTFYAKPNGLDAEWSIWQEDIVIEIIPPPHKRISQHARFARDYPASSPEGCAPVNEFAINFPIPGGNRMVR